MERAEVTHHLSTQFARFGCPRVARGWRHPEPASPYCLGIMACAVHEDDACEMRATPFLAQSRVTVCDCDNHPRSLVSPCTSADNQARIRSIIAWNQYSESTGKHPRHVYRPSPGRPIPAQ